MSDMSVLSHEYKTASELSQHISMALILLKKVNYHLPGGDAVTPEELHHHSHTLATILTTLVSLLTIPRPEHIANTLGVSVPETLVMRLQAERQGDLIYYLEDLVHMAEQLREQPTKLDETDFALLDQLATVADVEASSVYRRLMRI